jgi:hypothetical protein
MFLLSACRPCFEESLGIASFEPEQYIVQLWGESEPESLWAYLGRIFEFAKGPTIDRELRVQYQSEKTMNWYKKSRWDQSPTPHSRTFIHAHQMNLMLEEDKV